jgi:outer membrane protein assembly factor BamD (BamD/ComL family)
MRCKRIRWLLAPMLLAACASPDRYTLSVLQSVEPDMTEVRVEKGLDQAMIGYRSFLEQAPESSLTPEAMRRLADLKLEKEFGIFGGGDGELVELPAPEVRTVKADATRDLGRRERAAETAGHPESERDFERRAAGKTDVPQAEQGAALELPGGEDVAWSGPLEAIELYDQLLETYPDYPHNDQVFYQKARALDELGRNDEAIGVIERLIAEYPHSRYIDEVQFRRAEYFFIRRNYFEAEHGYAAITARGASSDYYELALYKLGWALYKQELHEEALDEYIALLDYKVSTGYDFDQSQDEASERRIADTYRVISLSFSNLGGPEIVEKYFAANGRRSYEDRIYSHLGEFYLEKLRYNDAAASYQTFVGLQPLHRVAPHFSMRVVEIYEAGDFPILVLESKKDFASRYGLQSEYWRHFDIEEEPEVLNYLKRDLEDLATHYHALYQEPELEDEREANFEEALHWYRAYFASFPTDVEAPAVNQRLADLLLENEDFGEAAREYERTAYEYPDHVDAPAAGYAAIYAHREHEKAASDAERDSARRDAVTSTLRFVDAFPDHEHAAVVMGAAVDDLYDMKEFDRAIATGQRLIEAYPSADSTVRRSAWVAIAHSFFEIADFVQAEQAYGRVLEMTSADDDSRQAIVDNLAASIYKQGEAADAAGDYRAAADHYLRITQAAPTSEIRPAAEYDAGAALIRLEDWSGAAAVLEAFRETHPDHELNREATKQIASVRRKEGDLSRAAAEYERVAREADDPELRGEAMLLAGELYEDADELDRAVAVYLAYVEEFPKPTEIAVETRFTVAEIYQTLDDEAGYREQLRNIVAIDAGAGEERTDRVRYLAARSALVFSEDLFHRCQEVELSQPFEQNLQEKQQRMDAALEALDGLVEYEVAEVTAAATFYMAEIYSDFGRAMMESERPTDLDLAELQDYEMVLEEEAYPFEEKAIEVHEKNLELMASGIYNPWIEKSLGQLAILVPGRYAKFEASSGLIASLDSYAYRIPRSLESDTEGTQTDGSTDSGEPAQESGSSSDPDGVHEEHAIDFVGAR